MKEQEKPINIALVGLGGQGIITLAKLIANSAIKAGKHVCYNEIHGLSQRGGSVQSLVRLNDERNPVFAAEDVDIVIGLEKLETLRYLYSANNAKPRVIISDYYEIRQTAYFGYEKFPEEEEIDQEIKKHASELYVFDAEKFAKFFSNRFKPYNVGIFSAIIDLDLLKIPTNIAEEEVKRKLGRTIFLKRLNLKAFKEGKKCLKKI